MLTIACNEKPSDNSIQKVIKPHYTEFINPYDSVGIKHNILLSDIMSYLDLNPQLLTSVQAPSLSFDSLIASLVCNAYINTNINSNCTINNSLTAYYFYDTQSLSNTPDTINIGSIFNSTIESILLIATTRDYNYCQRIYHAIEFCSDENNYPNNQAAFLALNDSLTSISNSMGLESWISNEYFSLEMLSVAIHSCQFWQNYFLIHSMYKQKHPVVQEKATARQVAIVAADCVGALHGAYKGAIISSGTAIGTLVGAVGGGIIGAISYSAGMAGLFEIWDAWKAVVASM
ncbi:hypothetical protein D9V86_07425 [Bacteroidetes/Chlorobi group bacterium ChocPot_Mid]|nr:MAG: hypothetical protein D9V86_07425 [Bacteroidetes/Chlorobi group bacterium ChocPot_Mid]